MPRLTFQDVFQGAVNILARGDGRGPSTQCSARFLPKQMNIMDEKDYPSLCKLKAKIWVHFGFWRTAGGQDLPMSYAVCRLCKCKVKYCTNTTNFHLHKASHHPEQQLLAAGAKEAKLGNSVPSQPKMSDAFKSKYPSTSEQAQKITEALLWFICKDLRPYSVVVNEGFRQLLNECEPRYIIPTRRFITETVLPNLYKDMKEKVRDILVWWYVVTGGGSCQPLSWK